MLRRFFKTAFCFYFYIACRRRRLAKPSSLFQNMIPLLLSRQSAIFLD